MFPQIDTLADLIPFIEGSRQIRVKPDDKTGLVVVCYMVQDEDTFSGEHEGFERECRGITFYPPYGRNPLAMAFDQLSLYRKIVPWKFVEYKGQFYPASKLKIAGRTMHKFFNVGERDETRPENIDWSRAERVMIKRDGSMVTPVDLLDGRFAFKTKKSFSTNEANLAASVADKTPGGNEWIKRVLAMGMTPTFEITSPQYPIVVRYEKEELVLLHVRVNDSGNYLSEDQIEALGSPFPLVDNMRNLFTFRGDVSWDLLKIAAETTEGVEGWVVQMDDGEMFKIKTKWYVELHHSVTFTRWRDIARTVCAEQGDDLKAAFAAVGRSTEPVITVERKVHDTIFKITDEVNSIANIGKLANMTPKDMALKYKGHQYFGLIMRCFRGEQLNFMEYYVKHHLEQDWGLEVVA